MADTRSVHFSPIIEQASDETSIVSSDVGLFLGGMNFEDAHIASLSKSAKKYRLPRDQDDEARAPRTRKIALLSISFIILLAIGVGVAIYLITRGLYNKEGHIHSGSLGDTRIPMENTSHLVIVSTTNYSSEANTDTISIYPVMKTVSPPNQTRLFTGVTVYGPSTTSFVSRKYNLTDTSTFSSQEPESSEKAASLSLLTGDTITLLKISASAIFRSPKTDKPIAWTTHGFYSVGFAESSASTAFLSTITPSGPFSDSGAKMSIPSPVEKVRSVYASPLASTINVHTHAATRTLKNVGTVIRISPNSVSKHTLSSSETTAIKWSDTTVSNSARGNFRRVTKQSWQTRFGQTILSSVGTSKSGSYSGNSEKLVELQTASMTMKQETETISDLTTTSLDISLSVKHSDSAVFFRTFTESVMRSSFDEKWATSWPSSSSYVVTCDRMTSSNKNLSFWPQWTTWTQQISSSPHIATTGSMPIVFSLTLTFKTGASVSSKFLVKETETSHSPLATPLLSAQRLSTTEFVSQSERPSSTLSRGVSSPVITSSPSSLSSPRQESSTIKETQAIKPTMTISGGIFHSLRTTVSAKVTTIGQREPSSIVLVYYKSVVGSNVHTGNTVVPQSTYLTTLTQLPTHDGSSALNDEPLTKTSQKYSTSLSSARQSLAKAKQPSSMDAISLTNIPLSGPRTNAITLKPKETSKALLSTSPLESDTLSPLSPSNTLGKLETATCKATERNTHSSPFQSNGASYRSTFDSKPTFRRMTSCSTVESASTSVLAFPVVTSSFEHLMSTEIINESISLSKISPVSIKKLSSIFAYTLHRGASDTLMLSITASSTTALLPSARFLSTTELTSRKMTSNMFVLGLHSATSSAEPLESKKSIQESLLRPTVTAEFLRTSHTSHRLTTSTITGIAITTISPATRAASLSEGLLSSASDNSTRALSNTALSPQPMTNSTASASPVTHKTSTFQVTPSRNAVLSSVVTILVPSVDPTLNSSASFKIMDGSLIIRNKNYHTDLSNPNTTMFKELAEEVESIIMEIVSLNTTDILDAEVTSFRNGSVIADFYLRVRYDSSLSDQQYTKLLSDANGTMWWGFYVTNITVTLRATEESSSKPSQVEDNSGLSKVAVIATLTVLAGLLIAVGSFGVYVCKKKGLCVRATVKPADSPIPRSELEKIQPVRRGTWVMNDEPFLSVDVPTDPNYSSSCFYETLSLRVLERIDTAADESLDPDLLRESMRSPFEPERTNNRAVYQSKVGIANPSTSRSISDSSIDNVDRPISGSSRTTYLNMASNSSTL